MDLHWLRVSERLKFKLCVLITVIIIIIIIIITLITQ